MTRRVVAFSIAVCGWVSGIEAQNAPAGGAPVRTNTVYVTVTESTGVPVLDLTPTDFAIKEDGKNRDVLGAEVANAPLQIMLIVDDNGTGFFRSGLMQFVQQMQGRADIALSTVTGQTQKLVDYTPNPERVAEAIATLSARPGTPDGGQLLEGIFQAAKEQEKREARRPVIVALTVGGEEHITSSISLRKAAAYST
jgi:hypothetical protein